MPGECGPWALLGRGPAGDLGHLALLPKHQRLFPWPLPAMPWEKQPERAVWQAWEPPTLP